ncbi:conserved hypothetical protein [Frankia canadensis]|uniref:HD domain-containing protein n=1 Tax=Frankia canadensis TaxID=1836972 RepID=A0A2I2KWH0_9ACTN|nr:hypothetical protein [Frankia canadensis]SNQ50011.1 conserved hypothetical protein [Frankia canadensis]SOU57301.1 conserved hypothetical protein [Frankia canadensis]
MSAVGAAGAGGPRSPLARVFDDALVTAGARADPGERVAAFVDLARRYQEPGRHYHTLRHVAEMTAALRVLLAAERPAPAARSSPEGATVHACVLAGYFHDAVLVPRRIDNEQRSAQLAVAVLERLGCPGQVGETVARLVLATAAHRSHQPDEALVNDADLRILSRHPAAYDQYVRRVRREYGGLDDQVWRAGRGAVVRALLSGPVYATAWARRAWEPTARLNLLRELDALG